MTPLVSLIPSSSIELDGYSHSRSSVQEFYCVHCDCVIEGMFLTRCRRCKGDLRMISAELV